MKMPDLNLEAIAAGNEVVTYPDGGVVFLRGAVGDCAYIVRQGVVEIREAGRVLERLIPGDVFGEMALIDNETRSASAVAVGETALVIVDRTTFNRLVRNEPDFALAIMQAMARRLRAMNALQKDAREELPVVPRSRNSA